jgi:hypothetical protein
MHHSYINETPPIDGDICDLVDWIEFKAIANEFRTFKLADLRSLSEELEDEVDDNITYQDNLDEVILQNVFSEIALRQKSLHNAYPFLLDNTTYELTAIQTDNITLGGWVYLYCLIISHPKPDDVLKTSIGLTPYDKRRDYLQVAATYASGADFGNAISFGFPRPDHSNILHKIHSVFANHIKEGVCLKAPRDGYLTDSKDAGIDVIAWKNSLDDLPGKQLMYGQVASGENWESKSIIEDVKMFYKTFFYDDPGSHWLPAMFIPFCLTREKAENLINKVNALTYQFGIIYYRYRLPRLAQLGYEAGSNQSSGHYIERINEYQRFQEFVESFSQAPSQA